MRDETATDGEVLVRKRYETGSVHHLVRGEAKQYKFHEGGFALELAQGESLWLLFGFRTDDVDTKGWIPLMLPFGFGDGLSSTLDFPTLWQTTFLTGTLFLIASLVDADTASMFRTRDDQELAPRQDLATELQIYNCNNIKRSHQLSPCPLPHLLNHLYQHDLPQRLQ